MDLQTKLQTTSQWNGFWEEVNAYNKKRNNYPYSRDMYWDRRISGLVEQEIKTAHEFSKDRIVAESTSEEIILADYHLNPRGSKNKGIELVPQNKKKSDKFHGYMQINKSLLYTFTPQDFGVHELTWLRGSSGDGGARYEYDFVLTLLE